MRLNVSKIEIYFFLLTLPLSHSPYISKDLSYDAAAAEIQSALNALARFVHSSLQV